MDFSKAPANPRTATFFSIGSSCTGWFLSGVVMAGVNCPVELLKVRLQVQDHKNRVNLECILLYNLLLYNRSIKVF